jgi:hypothetical protein
MGKLRKRGRKGESRKGKKLRKNGKDFVKPYLLTYLLTHSLTPWCRILFENLIITRQKISCFLYGT